MTDQQLYADSRCFVCLRSLPPGRLLTVYDDRLDGYLCLIPCSVFAYAIESLPLDEWKQRLREMRNEPAGVQ